MDLGLRGKVAVITGGSEGIGRAAAIEFAREGAHVAICARRADVLEAAAGQVKAAGGDVLAVSLDVTEPGRLEAFVQQAIDRWGGVDILLNNVGTSAAGAFETVTDEIWQQDLDLKFFSAVRATRVAIPSMRARGGGRIINITTVGGKQPGASSVPTTVTRAAGIALTKAMSKDLAKDNILVNTVCVSLAKSGQTSRRGMARNPGRSLDEVYADMGARLPLGRVAEAEEVANVIVFLASARASYITGASVNVDGGLSGAV
ncbi:MAG: SDR family oxidoreductase [Dehalococcoidia bacterium]|nr:SDR family oxidoreductase [Dehalococcoidia bacterium]